MNNSEITWQHSDKNTLWQAISNAQFALDTRTRRDDDMDPVLFDVQQDHVVIHLTQVGSMLVQKINTSHGKGCGRFVVSLSTLHEILKGLPENQTVTIRCDNKLVNIEYPDGCFQLFCMEADRQMDFAHTNLKTVYEISTRDLHNGLIQTGRFMGDDTACIYLNGVYMQKKEDGISFVATDAHRLMHRKIPKDRIQFKGSAECDGFLIPRKSVMTLQRLLSTKQNKTVQIGFNKHQMQFCVDDITFVTNALEGEFPDYESVILDTKNATECMQIKNTEAFLQALDRVMCISLQKTSMITLKVSSSGLSSIESKERGVGTARESVSIEAAKNDHEIYFNGRYLWDMIKCTGCDNMCLHFYNQDSQVIFTSEQDQGFIGLLMPMFHT